MKQPMLTLVGAEAITVGGASNRLPEVLVGDRWKTAFSLADATTFMRADPQTVRLTGGIRAIVEDITKQSMPLDTNLASALALLKDDDTYDQGTRDAFTIIWNYLQ